MWTALYRFLLYPVFTALLWLFAAVSPKVRRGLRGRRNWREQLQNLPADQGDNPFRIHFHAASVGEFEQAKPLIEKLRADGDRWFITASFFSPSGYEQQRNYAPLDAACYLPPDRQSEMSDFLDRIRPDLIIIIRYDLWLEFLLETRRRSIPAVLVCGVLREDSARFRSVVRGFFEKLYALPALIHAVGDADRAAFQRLVPEAAVEVSGDTRYDRVVTRARAAADLPAFTPELIAGRSVLVAGSTWPPDEELLRDITRRDDLLLVIVPHEPTPEHVSNLLGSFPGSAALSQVERGEVQTEGIRAIVVDRTGILSALYRIGGMAYVGGAFGEGVHSVLEPAAYGIPVFCGPRIHRSRDAEEMRNEGALTVVTTGGELAVHVDRLMNDEKERQELGARVLSFTENRVGATERIIQSLRRRKLLP